MSYTIRSPLSIGSQSIKEPDVTSLTDEEGQSNRVSIGVAPRHEEARDEVKEIQKISLAETRLIRTWRVILLILLVATAATVSSLTYNLLRNKERDANKATVCTHVNRKFHILDAVITHRPVLDYTLVSEVRTNDSRGYSDA